jgi:hypothetical protein
VPLIPLAMITIFAAGTAGLVLSPAFAAWLAVPANIILSYVVAATHWFASVPWAQKSASIQWQLMMGFYAALAFGTLVLYKYSNKRFDQLPGIVD